MELEDNLFDNFPECICVLDDNDIIVKVNNACVGFGYASDDMKGKKISEFIYPDDVGLLDRSNQLVELKFLVKKLTKDTAISKYHFVRYFRHKKYVVILDVNDKKEAVAMLAKTKDQLFQSEKLASIGQLSAGIAHEINNPLGFISNNIATLGTYVAPLKNILTLISSLDKVNKDDAQLLKAKIEEIVVLSKRADIDYILGDLTDLVDESLQGLDRIKKIVMDLKLFAHKDSDEQGPADLPTIIDGAINIVWNRLKYTCQLVKDYQDTPQINCNVQQITQVFVNLMVNAAQAIEKQGIITISVYPNGNTVFAQVRDTGKGIPEEIMDKIFDPLFTTKEPGQGTGLGLSITNEIIKKHNAEIKVESQLGAGTVFTLMFPAVSNC